MIANPTLKGHAFAAWMPTRQISPGNRGGLRNKDTPKGEKSRRDPNTATYCRMASEYHKWPFPRPGIFCGNYCVIEAIYCGLWRLCHLPASKFPGPCSLRYFGMALTH